MCLHVVQPLPASSFKTFSSSQKITLCPLLNCSLPILPPHPMVSTPLLSACVDLPVLNISYKWNLSVWPSLTGLFHSASVLKACPRGLCQCCRPNFLHGIHKSWRVPAKLFCGASGSCWGQKLSAQLRSKQPFNLIVVFCWLVGWLVLGIEPRSSSMLSHTLPVSYMPSLWLLCFLTLKIIFQFFAETYYFAYAF